MKRLIQYNGGQEGEVFMKWLHQRLIVNNKNVLGANLGPTGSGKSYRDLRMAELWYDYHFKKPFPTENICFGTTSVMRLISKGELPRGSVLMVEEAGINLGSLDFQNKVAKMFTYILQSFRSMNIALFFNLPYLSMLNKTARMLLHYSFESAGIDFTNKINKCKPLFHQVNQGTGKIYKKYLRVKVKGKRVPLKRFNFSIPSEYLVSAYEKKKAQYLADISKEYTEHLEELEREKLKAMERPELTDVEMMVYKDACNGLTTKQIAEKHGYTAGNISQTKKRYKKKGYLVVIPNNSLENGGNLGKNPLQTPV
jgi:DNA-binding CsgD family transcriptional regulator